MAPLREFREFIRNQGAINGKPAQISRRGRIHAALAYSGTTIFIYDQGIINGAPAQISRRGRIHAALAYSCGPGALTAPEWRAPAPDAAAADRDGNGYPRPPAAPVQ